MCTRKTSAIVVSLYHYTSQLLHKLAIMQCDIEHAAVNVDILDSNKTCHRLNVIKYDHNISVLMELYTQ